MTRLELQPFLNGANGQVKVPGSKSLTNRALLLCALAAGDSVLEGALESEDSKVMQEALTRLGVTLSKTGDEWGISGMSGRFLPGDQEIYLGNSGTSMRFLAASAVFGQGTLRLYGKPRMHERPIADLLTGLQQLGADIRSESENGCPPVIIHASGEIEGGECELSGATSSQFLSAILHIAPLTRKGVRLKVIPPLVSEPYLEMTIKVLEAFGVQTEQPEPLMYFIPPQPIKPVNLAIEGDASGAAHVFSLAAAAGGRVTVTNFPQESLQGDAKFLEVLQRFGAKIHFAANGTTVEMEGDLQPLGEIDLEHIPDAGMSAVTLAALARGNSKITGLSTLRKKECDRVEALRLNLAKMGADVTAGEDFIEIVGDPAKLHGAEIETFDDHRVAMSFAALGTRVPHVIIFDPACTGKTFPDFWEIFEACRKK